MDSQENSKQGCDCSDGCCASGGKKGNLWKKIASVTIICAVVAVVAVKLVAQQGAPSGKRCDITVSTCSTQVKQYAASEENGDTATAVVSKCCPQAKQAALSAKSGDTLKTNLNCKINAEGK